MSYLKCQMSCERQLVSFKQASVDVVKGGEGDAVDERANTSLNVNTHLGVLHRLTENHIKRLDRKHRWMHIKETVLHNTPNAAEKYRSLMFMSLVLNWSYKANLANE